MIVFQHANNNVQIVLVGNKCDMDGERIVAKECGIKVCSFECNLNDIGIGKENRKYYVCVYILCHFLCFCSVFDIYVVSGLYLN